MPLSKRLSRLVYRNEITYEGWLWEYHRVTIAVARGSRAEAIAMALLAMHVQHIREDTRLPWSGECRFDLTQGDEQPEWVQAYERARIARMREEQR